MAHDDERLVLKRTTHPEAADAGQAEDQLGETPWERITAGTGALRPAVHRLASLVVPARRPVERTSLLVAGARLGGDVRLQGKVGQAIRHVGSALAAVLLAGLEGARAEGLPAQRRVAAARRRPVARLPVVALVASRLQASGPNGPATAKQVPAGRHVASGPRPVPPARVPLPEPAVPVGPTATVAGQVGPASVPPAVPSARPTRLPTGPPVAPAAVLLAVVQVAGLVLRAARRTGVVVLAATLLPEARARVRNRPVPGLIRTPNLGPVAPAGAAASRREASVVGQAVPRLVDGPSASPVVNDVGRPRGGSAPSPTADGPVSDEAPELIPDGDHRQRPVVRRQAKACAGQDVVEARVATTPSVLLRVAAGAVALAVPLVVAASATATPAGPDGPVGAPASRRLRRPTKAIPTRTRAALVLAQVAVTGPAVVGGQATDHVAVRAKAIGATAYVPNAPVELAPVRQVALVVRDSSAISLLVEAHEEENTKAL